MLHRFRAILNDVRAAFAEPDPLRFAHMSTPAPNWNGELVGVRKQASGPVLVNKETVTFEFGRTDVHIDPFLTALDIQELRKRKLDPDNPAYATAKSYFAKMPFCNKEDLAANSGGPTHEAIKPNTAKDALGAFRAFLVDKPTF